MEAPSAENEVVVSQNSTAFFHHPQVQQHVSSPSPLHAQHCAFAGMWHICNTPLLHAHASTLTLQAARQNAHPAGAYLSGQTACWQCVLLV